MPALNKAAVFQALGYKPTEGQWEFHNSDARFKIAVCGRRYGKSTMSARDIIPDLFRKNKRYWIVGPTYYLGEKEFRIIWQDLMIGMGLAKNKQIKKAYNKKQGNMFIEFPWGTALEVRSATDPDSLVGENLNGVIMAEAAKHNKDTWVKYIRPSLADERGFATFTTTPEGYNWIYNLYMEALDEENYEYKCWRLPSWENESIFPGGRDDPEIKLMERTMPSSRFAQEIAADFTTFVGKIYPEFTPETHVKRHEYRPDWPNYQFWDFGFVNALCCLDVQISPRDEVFVWREAYDKGISLQEMINYFKTRNNPPGYQVVHSFGDAADQEAVLMINRLWKPCIALQESKTNWRDGIEVVKKFLEERPDGSYGVYVDPSCNNTIREFMTYQMASTKTKNDPMEKPLKKDDHAMDALRYGIMHIFELGATRHLAEADPIQRNYEFLRKGEPTKPIFGPKEFDLESLGTRGFFTSDVSF